MQIVIDIDEDTYKDIKRGKIYTSVRDVPQESILAIANGTPLPTDAVDRVTIKEYLESFEVAQPKMVSSSENPNKWIPVSERLPRASEIVLLSLPEHTMVDGEECFPCIICGHYIGGKSEEWGISDGTTVGYGLVAYKHCKPIAWMPLPEPYQPEILTEAEGSEE